MIKLTTYPISNNVVITNEILANYINLFWSDIFNNIKDTSHLMLMCKVQFTESVWGMMEYKTLGHLRKVNFDDKELFIEYLSARLSILNESYTVVPISNINFSYIIKEGLATDNRRLLQDIDNKSLAFHSFNNMNLPVSMNPGDYGTIIASQIFDTFTRYIATSGNKTFQIDVYLDKLVNKVTILGAINLEWIDTTSTNNLGNVYTFKREIKKSTIYFVDGEVVLRKQMLNAKNFRKVSTETELNSEFVTMDIETVKKDSKLTPYLICAYNGTDYITSYADKSLDQNALFTSFINQLLTFFSKGKNTITIYAHNFSSFDGVFFTNKLMSYGKVDPLLHEGKIITIRLKLNIEGYKNKTIIFKDSYLLLPQALRKLCEAFGIESSKGYFPFNLANIYYVGLFPKFEYWTGINLNEYSNLVKKYTGVEWNFKDEAIKYCKLDCLVLYQILVRFNELIFNKFKLNVHLSLTLPTLAMNIYKSQFMPENTIYQLPASVESDIRQSYTGGAVDVYIPHNKVTGFFGKVEALFKQLYYYDVNSLYPFIMAKTPMPVGKPIAFEGDIRLVEPKAFGFFYCKITSPEYLEHPILHRRIKTSDGLRTIAGLGSWTGWIFSGEMDNAMNYGYTFEILKGYQFEKGYIFKDYVETMYNLRMEYPKGDPMNLIAKLLMNSLYGKFGMKLESTVVEIFDTTNDSENQLLQDMLELYGETIIDYIEIDNKVLTVRKKLLAYKNNDDDDTYHGLDVNVAIASAITAGGRMWMSSIKNNPDFNLYYSDNTVVSHNKYSVLDVDVE